MTGRPFVLPLIPPNLTGDLHLGHALMATVQDAVVRSVRQSGREAVFVPGVDHAGIGMYALVRADTAFLPDRPIEERLAAWAAHHRDVIGRQFRSLLLACDWNLEVYTLDPGYVDLVHWAFRTLAERGLVHRGHRLVHRCPSCATALSDMECEVREAPRPVAVVPVRVGARLVLVETPEPERLDGAVALALPGGPAAAGVATVAAPAGGDPLPVVDGPRPAFVAGPVEAASTEDRERRRREAVERLRLRTTVRPVPVLTCGRCGTEVVEQASRQWFVRMGPLVAPVLDAVRSGEVRITPEPVRRQAIDWLAKAQDWCVSRQIPWGQVIPARRCTAGACDGFTVDGDGPCPACGAPTEPETDVFDTWFSSSLWPLGTAGWPDEAALARRYPADLMTSGRDILFFLFVRLLALGRELTGRFPVAACHFHGLVRDAHGQKMSKSRGNTVTVDAAVAEHGADVVRLALLSGCHEADDLRAAPELFARAARVRAPFADLAGLGAGAAGEGGAAGAAADGLDHWCAARAEAAVEDVRAALAEVRVAAAAAAVDAFATGPLARYVATRRRAGAPAHPAVVAAAARVAEPVLPGVAADLRAAAGGDGDGWRPDPITAAAAGAAIGAVEELEALRGAVGVPAGTPVPVELGGRAAAVAGEAWVRSCSRLAVDPGAAPAGVPWRPPGRPEVTLWLPSRAAPRLRREAARRLRAASDRRRALTARLAEAESGGATAAAARLAPQLAAVTARIRVLRQNAAAAADADDDVPAPA
ncbi:MAG TPA: class I tRNA ligase family protein [Acidimicrobiales bacterium]